MVAVRVVVSVALLTLLLSRVDRGALWDSVRHASVPWLAFALLIYFVHIVTGAWRWRLLLVPGTGVVMRTASDVFIVEGQSPDLVPSGVASSFGITLLILASVFLIRRLRVMFTT